MPFPVLTTHNTGDTIQAADVNNLNTAATTLNNTYLSAGMGDVPLGGEEILNFICPVAMRIPGNLTGSYGAARVAPTASTVVNVQKRVSGSLTVTTVATFTFAATAAPVSATLSTQAAVDFAAGDELIVACQPTADATFSKFTVTINLIYP